MTRATYEDVARLFPGLQDHAVVELLAARAAVDELEAVSALLAGNEEEVVEVRRREGGRIDRLLNILSQSGIQPQQDRDR